MIDIHAHILPGLDDGAQDIYDALEMANLAVESGITEMIATPHCNIPGMFRNYYDGDYKKVFQATEQVLKEEGVPLKLYPGVEVFMTPDVPSLLKEGKIRTLKGGHYILVEFGFDEDPDFATDMLTKMRNLGLHPIVAHPERYEFVQDTPQIVYEWRKKKCLMQLNKSSLMGSFGKHAYRTAHQLLAHNLASVIASDAHSPVRRTPYMLDVYDRLSEDYSEKYLKVLFEENPKRICRDLPTLRFELKPFEEMW